MMAEIYCSDDGIYSPGYTESPAALEDPDTRDEATLAPMYWVVMHNDPVTTMDFVVETLVRVFGYANDRAFETMYTIHTTGLSKVAVLPLERAEIKVAGIHLNARSLGFPLTCTIEPD